MAVPYLIDHSIRASIPMTTATPVSGPEHRERMTGGPMTSRSVIDACCSSIVPDAERTRRPACAMVRRWRAAMCRATSRIETRRAHAEAETELRVLRPRPAAGFARRTHLHLRVHLLR